MKDAPPRALAELQSWPHWVVWRVERRDDKTTKVPYQAAHPSRKASSTDESTWGTYEQALAAVGRADGIGYVFADHDEYCGVDLDKCVEPAESGFAKALGPTVRESARRFVTELDSYTELSPTGTGLHIIVRGRVNGDRNRTGKTPWGGEFEFYDHARFFTITGEHLIGTPTVIEARQAELDRIAAELFPPATANVALTNGKPPVSVDLDDFALEEKIRKDPERRALYDRLMAGDTSQYGDDESAADMALCNLLAWWTNRDVVRMDSWFRRSGLCRDKWEREDYRERTIGKAIADCNGGYDPTYRPAPKKFEGRDEALAAARERAAELLGIDDRKVIGGRSWGEDLEARVEVDISDGSMLVFRKLGTYTAPAKLMGLISFQIGGSPALTQATVNELFRSLRLICDFHEAVTLDGRARDCGTSFIQEAPTIKAEMVNDQAGRWDAMAQLADKDPVAAARASQKSIAAESLVVVDKADVRYVRASWFAAYARSYAAGATAEQILERIVGLGWGQPGTEGRIKATQPNTKKTLNWAFFTVPKGWEEQ